MERNMIYKCYVRLTSVAMATNIFWMCFFRS